MRAKYYLHSEEEFEAQYQYYFASNQLLCIGLTSSQK